MIYSGDNKQIKIEFKKILLDENITLTEIAERMEISKNQLNNTFNKINLSFNDVYKMASAAGYELQVDFIKKC